MSDDKKKKVTEPTPAPPAAPPTPVGKQWRGQRHFAITTPEQAQLAADTQKKYNKPGAISLEAYLAQIGIRDVVVVAARKAHTTVRFATVEDWTTIFANY